jgi:hypothetical protein
MLMVGGILSTAGRAGIGLVADRVGAPAAGFLSHTMSLMGTLCLIGLDLHTSLPLVIGYVLFLFLPLGTRATRVSILVARIAPPAKFGSVFGWLAVGIDLIVSAAGPAAPAVKNATSTIPIVLATSFYPVEQGLIASLRHPGGNITGVTHFTPELMAKRVQLLKELLPRASRSPCCGCPERCRISSCATWRRPPVSSAPSSRWSRCSAGKTSRRRSTPRLVVGLRRS